MKKLGLRSVTLCYSAHTNTATADCVRPSHVPPTCTVDDERYDGTKPCAAMSICLAHGAPPIQLEYTTGNEAATADHTALFGQHIHDPFWKDIFDFDDGKACTPELFSECIKQLNQVTIEATYGGPPMTFTLVLDYPEPDNCWQYMGLAHIDMVDAHGSRPDTQVMQMGPNQFSLGGGGRY